LRYHDNSQLVIFEHIERVSLCNFNRVAYRYYYQGDNGSLIFRYDNSPHHPQLATFPAHKHVGDTVIAAEPPDLTDVLRKIDVLLYPTTDNL